MSLLIAISGKGGVGKTTIAGLLINRLIIKGCQPVLAIDADPNTCLDGVLGVKVEKTVGRVREEAREDAGKGLAIGIAKQEMLQMKIAESLVETEKFDLIAMGRPEGAGCYCYANNVLKNTISEIAKNYPYVVLDNEAGLENLSRRIVQEVDILVMVADPSKRGIETLIRLYELAKEMEIKYKKLVLVINRLHTEELPAITEQLMAITSANLIIGLPEDDELSRLAEEGTKLQFLSESNPVIKRMDEMMQKLGII